MSSLSGINEGVRSDKKPVGALVHSIQAVSVPAFSAALLTLVVLQGKTCHPVVGDR
jgi:hypothetical protein